MWYTNIFVKNAFLNFFAFLLQLPTLIFAFVTHSPQLICYASPILWWRGVTPFIHKYKVHEMEMERMEWMWCDVSGGGYLYLAFRWCDVFRRMKKENRAFLEHPEFFYPRNFSLIFPISLAAPFISIIEIDKSSLVSVLRETTTYFRAPIVTFEWIQPFSNLISKMSINFYYLWPIQNTDIAVHTPRTWFFVT